MRKVRDNDFCVLHVNLMIGMISWRYYTLRSENVKNEINFRLPTIIYKNFGFEMYI